MWMASLLVELLSSQSLWILSMPNTEAPYEELSLVVKKWKQEGTFCCTHLSTEASLEAFPLHSHCSRCSANHPPTSESCLQELVSAES